MINWDNYRIGDVLNLIIKCDDEETKLSVEIIEFEWFPHPRKPIIADVEVIQTDDNKQWSVGNVMRLPLITKDDEFKFLVKCPTPMHPNDEKTCRGIFYLQNNN